MRESTKKKVLFWIACGLGTVSLANGAFALKTNIDNKKAQDNPPAQEQIEDEANA